jgi:lysophospholipase L1-like esterase
MVRRKRMWFLQKSSLVLLVSLLLFLSLISVKDVTAVGESCASEKVVLIGDSLTVGYGPKFQQLCGGKPTLIMEGGKQTSWMLQQLKEKVINKGFTHLIILGGGNDISAGKSVNQITPNLDQIYTLAKQNELIVIAGAKPPKNVKTLPQQNEVVKQMNTWISQQKNIGKIDYFVDFYQLLVGVEPCMKPEYGGACTNTHPGGKGYQLMAETLKQQVFGSSAIISSTPPPIATPGGQQYTKVEKVAPQRQKEIDQAWQKFYPNVDNSKRDLVWDNTLGAWDWRKFDDIYFELKAISSGQTPAYSAGQQTGGSYVLGAGGTFAGLTFTDTQHLPQLVQVSQGKGLDPCMALVTVKHESNGKSWVVGNDANVDSCTVISRRKLLLDKSPSCQSEFGVYDAAKVNSGKLRTFCVSEYGSRKGSNDGKYQECREYKDAKWSKKKKGAELAALKAKCMAKLSPCLRDFFDLSSYNLNVPRSSPEAAKAYFCNPFDAGYTYGIGLGQITPGVGQKSVTHGGITYDHCSLFDPQKNIQATVAELLGKLAGVKSKGLDPNSKEGITLAFSRYVGGNSNPAGPRRYADYLICKANALSGSSGPTSAIGTGISTTGSVTGAVATSITNAPRPQRTTNFKFIVLGDSRWTVSKPSSKHPKLMQGIANLPADKKPDFILNMGDMTCVSQCDSVTPEKARQMWQRDAFTPASYTLQKGIGYYPVFGNHDMKEYDWAWSSYIANSNVKPGYKSPYAYSFAHGNSYFISFDDYKGGQQAATWVEQEINLAKSQGYQNIFAFAHIPLDGPVKGHAGDYNSQCNLFGSKMQGKVTTFFSGHSHVFDYRVIESSHAGNSKVSCQGIKQIVTGGGGAGIGTHENGGKTKHHFLLVEVNGGTVTATKWDLIGDQIQQVNFDNRWVPGNQDLSQIILS